MITIKNEKNTPASHAHTLLLDLDEIEVMTKLKDKLNIDSMNVPPSLATNNNNLLTDAQTLTNSCNRSANLGDGSTLDTLDKNRKKYSFDDYLDFSKSPTKTIFCCLKNTY